MEGEETVFDRNYEDYLAQLENIPIESIAPNLGGKVEEGLIKIPLFGINYEISVSGILDPQSVGRALRKQCLYPETRREELSGLSLRSVLSWYLTGTLVIRKR
jgi:hypothetical protein